MWTSRGEPLSNRRGLRFAVDLDSRPATVAGVMRGWQTDAGFRSLFNALLADVPFAAFRWETPAVTSDTANRPFECVLLDAPGLARIPDEEAFAAHFGGAPRDIEILRGHTARIKRVEVDA